MPPWTDLLGFPLELAVWLLFCAGCLLAVVAFLRALDWLLARGG